MKDEYIYRFYDEVKQNLDGDYKIILEPTRKIKEDWIEYDKVKWEMEEEISQLVEKLLKENSMSFEDKVLEVYKYICLNYVYDANVLYFFKRDSISAYISGWIQSSLSTKPMYAPAAASSPAFRALLRPPFSL